MDHIILSYRLTDFLENYKEAIMKESTRTVKQNDNVMKKSSEKYLVSVKTDYLIEEMPITNWFIGRLI